MTRETTLRASTAGPSSGLGPALAAVRARLGLTALLFALAAAAWWWSVQHMSGMDNGPWTGVGTFGWFIGTWTVMMAAMMVPSIAPTVALYSRMMRRRSAAAPLLFAGGYLIVWGAAGLAAYAIAATIRGLGSGALGWDQAGRWLAGATLIAAAAYELTPLKDACLGKCRSPLGFLLGSWRDGPAGALQMGARNGGWCIGCCWALMASLFALGIMSVAWMAFGSALIAMEKTIPWRSLATYGIAALLLALGVLLLLAPDAIPWLTMPDSTQVSQMGGS